MGNEITALGWTIHTLERLVEQGEKQKKEFVERFNDDPIHALEWQQKLPQVLHAARLAKWVLDLVGKKDSDIEKEAVLKEVHGLVLEDIDRWTPRRSTCPYSNAMDEEKLLAMREVRDALKNIFCEG